MKNSNFGNLFIVSTPIGHLEDITLRALNTLKDVDFIAAEDTRHSKNLLNHYNINTPLFAFHDHNEKTKTDFIIDKLKVGQSIALISDAGTPLINDPGYFLVKMCHENNIKVVPIPGACAAIAALSASGLPTDKFSYHGFLPAKQKARIDYLNSLILNQDTFIFYESTHRILDALNDIQAVFGEQKNIVLAKELTKTWESIISKPVMKVIEWLNHDVKRINGEFVIIIEGCKRINNDDEIEPKAKLLFEILIKNMPLKQAIEVVSQIYDTNKNQLYKLGLAIKNSL